MTQSRLLPTERRGYDSGVLRTALAFLLLISAPVTWAEYRSFTRESTASGLIALFAPQERIDAWFFHSRTSKLLVLDEGDGNKRYGSLERAMERENCVAGTNGGYFSADSTSSPIGLVRHGGKRLHPLATEGFTVAGVLYDTGHELKLERSARLSTPGAAIQEAIQGGPFLVENARPVPGLNATRSARRTFVATDGAGNWCLGVSSSLTLDALARWLNTPGSLGSFKVKTALNLDGGTSSAFWVKSPKVHYPGIKPVRNYIGITPRRS